MEVFMRRTLPMMIGGVFGLLLLVLALWAWRGDEDFATGWGAHNLRIARIAVRCAAVALASAGEALLLILVVRKVYKRDAITGILGALAILVFMISAASAVALGLAGR
jgi:hypothetical protein